MFELNYTKAYPIVVIFLLKVRLGVVSVNYLVVD